MKNFSIVSLICALLFICIITLNNTTPDNELTSKSSYISYSRNSYSNVNRDKHYEYPNKGKRVHKHKWHHYSTGLKAYFKRIKIKIMYTLNDICRFFLYSIKDYSKI